jgi:hypothetical protein
MDAESIMRSSSPSTDTGYPYMYTTRCAGSKSAEGTQGANDASDISQVE